MNKLILLVFKALRALRLWELNSYLQDDPNSVLRCTRDAENAVYNLSKSITYYKYKK